ncbi:MAG: hypothetical protein K9L83_10745 [Deltaproteobacteria bacterium]|nr:hypothetical protein [Deltaproteobacteria bacterium]
MPPYRGPDQSPVLWAGFFTIYALDTELAQEPGLTKAELLKAMKGHILAEGQLMGRYKR